MKRRKPLLNRTPLRGTPKPVRPAKQTTCTPRPRPIARSAVALPMATPMPKVKPWRSRAYRMLVAGDPCEHCGIVGYSQAAHDDTDKGMGTKTGDETCHALCGPHPGLAGMLVEGYHEIIGRRLDREPRRAQQAFYAQRTRARHRARCAELGIDLPPEAPGVE